MSRAILQLPGCRCSVTTKLLFVVVLFFFLNPDKGARIWVVVYFEHSPGVTRLVLTGDQKSVQSGRCESEWSSEYISWAVWREKEQISFCGFFFPATRQIKLFLIYLFIYFYIYYILQQRNRTETPHRK